MTTDRDAMLKEQRRACRCGHVAREHFKLGGIRRRCKVIACEKCPGGFDEKV